MYFIEPSLDLGIIAALLDCFATTRNKHMYWSLPQRIRMCKAFLEKIIEHIGKFLSKYISKGDIDMKCSPNVGNKPSNPHMQGNQAILTIIKLYVIMRNDTGKSVY